MTSRQFRMLRSGLAGVDAIEAETRHCFSRHSHTQFGIGLIHRGAQKSASGRGPVEAGAGDIITVNPGEVHDGAPIGDTARGWRMLYLDPAVVAAVAADISGGQTNAYEFIHPVNHDRTLARRFEHLFVAVTQSPAEMQQQELLLLLLAALRDPGQRQYGSRGADIRWARQLIDDDPVASLSLAQLAKVSGISRFQLIRGFAKATGLTPHAYLLQRRIDLARRLIAAGTPLVTAAAESGFADQSHMTRLFVRAYGISPGAYAAGLN